MSVTVVRDAASSEWEAVAALQTRRWAAAYRGILSDAYLDGLLRDDRRRAWRDRMVPGGADRTIVVVAEEEGALVALACILGGDDPRWGSLIDNLHVRPDRVRTGLGRRALAAALERLAGPDAAAPLHLTVFEANARACATYESWGGVLAERFAAPQPDGRTHAVRRYAWPSPAALRAGLGAAGAGR